MNSCADAGTIRQRIRRALQKLKQQALVVWFLARQLLTPLPIKLLALFVAAYAFSPIDLIPDFIPVLGLLDDLIIVPLGIYWVMRLAPTEAVRQATVQADKWLDEHKRRPHSRIAAIVIVLIWVLLAVLSGIYLLERLH